MPAAAASIPQDAAAAVLRYLESFGTLGPDRPRRVDTHAAHVFLSGDRAWKLKRPVRYGYLDFSTPERRRRALEAELRLNRRTAPGLYIGLHAITRDAEGALAIDGDGEPIDWLLEMHRFPDDALLDDFARRGKLAPELMVALAERIHAFHDKAEIASGDGAAHAGRVIEGNASSFTACADAFDEGAVDTLLERQRERLARHAGLLDIRAAAGRVRHCHGDLHLANIALIDGEPVPFDCLEFDAELATVDVLYDLAFLLMDLWHRGLRAEANRLFNRYLDLSGEDEDGIAAMPLFLSLRAAVRAHVAGARARRGGGAPAISEARSYLEMAHALLDPVPPLLVAIGGRSGTGKSTLARALGGDIGAAPGARILRTDVLRKRLVGMVPEARIPATDYTTEASARVYAALDVEAGALLTDGASVIADAAFLTEPQRGAIAAVAARAGAAFLGLWLEAGVATRIERVRARSHDASDADARVVRLQARQRVGSLAKWQRLRASDNPERIAGRARRSVARLAPEAMQ